MKWKDDEADSRFKLDKYLLKLCNKARLIELMHADKYSTIIPVSGFLTETLLGGRSSKSGAKVRAYHGKQDNVIGFSQARQRRNCCMRVDWTWC